MHKETIWDEAKRWGRETWFAGNPTLFSDACRAALLPRYVVTWEDGHEAAAARGGGETDGGSRSMLRTFEREQHARNFFEGLSPHCASRTLMDRGRVLAASKTRQRAHHQAQVAHAAHAAACQTVLHVLPGSDNLLGPMASVARVHFLEGMGHFKHGCAQRCPSTRVPLCLVNPEAPDVKYVILHECMHHVLDACGVPALIVPQLHVENGACSSSPPRLYLGGSKVPESSALSQVDVGGDPQAVAAMVQTVWELVQHSRFNGAIRHSFGCGPESARDKQIASLLGGHDAWPYCSPKERGGKMWGLHMQIHYATVLLEGSERMANALKQSLLSSGEEGCLAEKRATTMASCITQTSDPGLWELEGTSRQAAICSMLMDLEAALNTLPLAFKVVIGPQVPCTSALDTHAATCLVSFENK